MIMLPFGHTFQGCSLCGGGGNNDVGRALDLENRDEKIYKRIEIRDGNMGASRASEKGALSRAIRPFLGERWGGWKKKQQLRDCTSIAAEKAALMCTAPQLTAPIYSVQ